MSPILNFVAVYEFVPLQ